MEKIKIKEVVEKEKQKIVERIVEIASGKTNPEEWLEPAAVLELGMYAVMWIDEEDLKGFEPSELQFDEVFISRDELEIYFKLPNTRLIRTKVAVRTPAEMNKEEFLKFKEVMDKLVNKVKIMKYEKRIKELEEELKSREEKIAKLEKQIKDMEELERKDREYCNERIKNLEEIMAKIKDILELEEDP